ncbi:MAG: hypothetical protein CVU47_08105 [Chloroflexi bacterium HGW-Chloroflexi-9]|nr:MAG: hypothetical protein CVU47_08105 [Chloroflexi bacterium HGW-Chloroflexi-9]
MAALVVVALLAPDQGAEAQQVGDAVLASGSVSVSGSYSATVTAAEGNTLPPSGSYEVSADFSASATATSFDVLSLTGTFISSGSYTAQVSATGVPAFQTTGSFNVTGTFSATSYTVDGSAALATPDTGSVAFAGSGSYDLGTSMVTAGGTYNGDVQTVAFGAAQVSGDYGGSGVVALNPQAVSVQIALPTNLLGGIAATAGMGPVAALALSTRAPAAPPGSGTGTGTFAAAPSFGTGNVGSAVFEGGTIAQLVTAVVASGGTSVWVQDSNGTWRSYSTLATGSSAFVNNGFNNTFAAGFGVTAVFVVR